MLVTTFSILSLTIAVIAILILEIDLDEILFDRPLVCLFDGTANACRLDSVDISSSQVSFGSSQEKWDYVGNPDGVR